MHLVSELDSCDTIYNKYIRPVVEMALDLFLLPNTTLTVKDTFTDSSVSGHFELVLSSPIKQQDIPLIFFKPGTIDTSEWILDQKLDPNRSYPSLTFVLTTALQLVPHVYERPYQIFVSDELHSMLLFITRMPTYTHVRAYICPEELSLRACILSLVMDHACTMRARIGIHDHYNGIAGVRLEDPVETLSALTPRCMLDFDMYSVQRDKTQTLWKVFLDWKEAGEREALQTHRLVVAYELGLPARSGSFLRRHIPYRSPFPQRRLSPADLSLLTPFPRLKDPITPPRRTRPHLPPRGSHQDRRQQVFSDIFRARDCRRKQLRTTLHQTLRRAFILLRALGCGELAWAEGASAP